MMAKDPTPKRDLYLLQTKALAAPAALVMNVPVTNAHEV
jgi:hypothetical protein